MIKTESGPKMIDPLDGQQSPFDWKYDAAQVTAGQLLCEIRPGAGHRDFLADKLEHFYDPRDVRRYLENVAANIRKEL